MARTWIIFYDGTYDLRISDYSQHSLYVDETVLLPLKNDGDNTGDLFLPKDRVSIQADIQSINFSWIEAGTFYLTKGYHSFSISAEGNSFVDLVALYPSKYNSLGELVAHFNSIDKIDGNSFLVSGSPMSLTIHMNKALEDFFLVSLTSYDEKLIANDATPMEVWGYANMFHIDHAETIVMRRNMFFPYLVGLVASSIYMVFLVFKWRKWMKGRHT